MKYFYKVKIVNPNKKSESIVRQLNNFSLKFASVEEAREKFKEQFGDQVPDCEFALGYFDGSQQAKVWLYTSEDFVAMYNKFPRGGTINLWCDGNHSNGVGQKRKRGDAAEQSSYHRQAKEEESEAIFTELQEKHSSKYDMPRLRLWSRMISAGIHDNYDEPPNIPAFSGSKRAKKETLSDCFSGAAVAVMKALQGNDKEKEAAPLSTGTSPGKSINIDLRMKNFEQLRYLQSLYSDGILTEEEYMEQKRGILDSLRYL